MAQKSRVAALAGAAASLAALAAPSPAQTIDDVRDTLRSSLRDVHFAKSFAGLVLLADELELAAANYRIDDAVDTELSVFALPFQRTFRPFGADAVGLHLEGSLGWARASQRTDDLYSGLFPGGTTSVETDWTTYGGLLGAGLEFELGSGLTFTPILDVALARIENEADYGGPGAALTATLFDGIAFNWSALALSAGPAARIDWSGPLGETHEFSLIARYDLRWTGTIDADDPAQEFSVRSQMLTCRGDLVGPTGIEVFERPLRWRATVGYRRFVEGSLFGADDLFQLGGGLEVATGDLLPAIGGLSLSGALIVGDGIDGWTLGLSASF
jgi:hypothetical protein